MSPDSGEDEVKVVNKDMLAPKYKKSHMEEATKLFCCLLSKCILDIDILVLMS